MRTVLKNGTSAFLPEELANSVIQGIGVLLSVLGLVFIISLAVSKGAVLAVASVTMYGVTLVLAYLSSTLYHATWHVRAKRILRNVDHSTIYLLIAGTYTPVALLVIKGGLGWTLLAIVWGVALTGLILRNLLPSGLLKLHIGIYIVLGWLIVAWAKPLYDGIGPLGTGLLVAGGLAYTLGVVFYRWEKLPFNEAIWHVLVIVGSACHFSSIAFYAVPAYTS